MITRILFYKVCRAALVVVGESFYARFLEHILYGLFGGVPLVASASGIATPTACRVRFINYATPGEEGCSECQRAPVLVRPAGGESPANALPLIQSEHGCVESKSVSIICDVMESYIL